MSTVRWVAQATLLLAIAAPLAPAVAGGATVTPPAPATTSDAKPDPFCASYGKGFTRLAGSSTCVKVSGNMQVDGYNQSFSGGGNPGALQPALRSK